MNGRSGSSARDNGDGSGLCRCHLSLNAPSDGRIFWKPWQDPEPDTAVRAVALAGQDPRFLRSERRADGWHTEGHAAAHPEVSPSREWGDLGRCWAGSHHPIVDATDHLAQRADDITTFARRASATPSSEPHDGTARRQRTNHEVWARATPRSVTVPVVVYPPDTRARRH